MKQPNYNLLMEHFRALSRTRVITASAIHFKLFDLLFDKPASWKDLCGELNLKPRPAMVLFPSLLAMGLLKKTAGDLLSISEEAKLIASRRKPNLHQYINLLAEDPGVREFVQLLENDGPVANADSIDFVKEGDDNSPMDDPETADYLTLALAGRAEFLAEKAMQYLPETTAHLLDAAGGSGYFTYRWLKKNTRGTATILDRPCVLKTARKCLDDFCATHNLDKNLLLSRITFLEGDMLEDTLPKTEHLLAASLFHDWPEETCQKLMHRFSGALKKGGTIWIHDAFLHDSLDGPMTVTDYSVQLFTSTKGRAYAKKEYFSWMKEAGIEPLKEVFTTDLDYALICGKKAGS